MSYKIFICYRRANKELARGIERELTKEFGTDKVFLDFDGIHGGQEWKKSVSNALEGDPIVVTLITTKWNSHRASRPKLLDPDDHVRFELETALGRGLTVISVLYERVLLPKKKQIPESLHPMLEFQTLPLSNSRWEYDAGRLVSALKDLLSEKSPKKPPKAKSSKPSPGLIAPPLAPTFTRSMFTMSPEQKKKWDDIAKSEKERRERARAESPAFYGRPSYWVCAILTIALTIGSLIGAEVLAQTIGQEFTLPKAPLVAGIVLACTWSIIWLAVAAASYSYDPDEAPKIFYTRGILGGWILGYEDLEPIGYWASFPIATAVLWLVARGLAMLAFEQLQWDYLLIFWIIIAAYTLPVAIKYSLSAADEVL